MARIRLYYLDLLFTAINGFSLQWFAIHWVCSYYYKNLFLKFIFIEYEIYLGTVVIQFISRGSLVLETMIEQSKMRLNVNMAKMTMVQ